MTVAEPGRDPSSPAGRGDDLDAAAALSRGLGEERQPEPGPLGFGREEGVENPLADIRRNPSAVVRDTDRQEIPGDIFVDQDRDPRCPRRDRVFREVEDVE